MPQSARLSLAESGIQINAVYSEPGMVCLGVWRSPYGPCLCCSECVAPWSIEPVDRMAQGCNRARFLIMQLADDGSYVLTVLAFEDVDLESLKEKNRVVRRRGLFHISPLSYSISPCSATFAAADRETSMKLNGSSRLPRLRSPR